MLEQEIRDAMQIGLATDRAWPGVDRDRGNCYAVAVHVARALVLCGIEAVVVHGAPIYRGPGGGRMGHAWVEVGGPVGWVIDYSNGLREVLAVSLYYRIGQIEPARCVRYDVGEAIDLALETGEYGPWTPFEDVLLG